MTATCTGAPTSHEALLVMQSSPSTVLADVTDATHPHTICTISGGWAPQLVTQRTISWWASQSPGSAGSSVIATMDLFAGASRVVAGWQGGFFMDGTHAWSPDATSLAYVTSTVGAVALHLLRGGNDRVVATLAAVPGRGIDPNEDTVYVGFSADGTYFTLVQTFAGGGQQLQVRRTTDGTIAYSQATGTMATWASTGSQLYFREPSMTTIHVWTPSGGVTQLFGLQQAWIHPVPDAGDDYVAYTVRDAGGTPHVWLYGHNGRAGSQLPNVRSAVAFLNTSAIFLNEEAPCPGGCGPGYATMPDGHNFIYDLSTQSEAASSISTVYGTWPRIGQ
jgi:hypothetical protein